MKSFAEFKKKALENPEVREAYQAQAPEFSLVAKLIAARTGAELTQQEVAKRMGTTQSVVARMEGGQQTPSLTSLRKYARAVGRELEISLR